ncbi:MAG TPA: aminotransferase class I/II-fold pyridoxal phosphate-dependent enzyme [Candidatus Polarisedimenticolaceae bacterium]|nr:aminotransferase class I/II-fold pyridoxal phosphate-dependent enzyme [Candidatus Polarisedimenticolaceae bacterium]
MSDYMRWAKTRQKARFTLARSGIVPLPIDELGARWEDLALETPGYGWEPLREAIGAMYGVAPERIVTAAGTSGANHLVLATLVARGDRVVVETPVYDPVTALLSHLGAVVVPLVRRADRGFAVEPGELDRALRSGAKLAVLTNLHNPSSAAIDSGTLEDIGKVAAHHGARVLLDEVYLDAAFEDAPPSAATLGDTFVVTSSLTKTCGLGGLRAGWIVSDPGLAGRLWDTKNLFGVDDAHVAERLALVGLRERPRLLARTRAILNANRASWNTFLAQRGADLDVAPSRFGTTAFPRVLRGSADALASILRERYETSIVPGRFFGAPEHVRIGFSCTTDEFPEGLRRLGLALEDLHGHARKGV